MKQRQVGLNGPPGFGTVVTVAHRAVDDLVKARSWSAARDQGTLRLEGRDYVVKDGDVVLFRLNV